MLLRRKQHLIAGTPIDAGSDQVGAVTGVAREDQVVASGAEAPGQPVARFVHRRLRGTPAELPGYLKGPRLFEERLDNREGAEADRARVQVDHGFGLRKLSAQRSRIPFLHGDSLK